MAFKMFALAKDELMLAGAVAVSLGSFGYMAVPWSGFGVGPADKAMALYEQIEKGNQAYFEKYGLWPHEVTNNTPTENVAVLMSRVPLAAEYRNSKIYQPVIMEGLLDTKGDSVVARHTYGQSGEVAQTALNGGAYRYVVEFSNLTVDEAKALDEKIDGDFSPTGGRLRIVERDGAVVAKYLANPRDASVASK